MLYVIHRHICYFFKFIYLIIIINKKNKSIPVVIDGQVVSKTTRRDVNKKVLRRCDKQ